MKSLVKERALKVFIESGMIFFGTLMTAALAALGGPAGAQLAIVKVVPARPVATRQLEVQHHRSRSEWSVTGTLLDLR